MDYIGNVIRPPSEANSIILQVTVGCSYNKCTFCGAYKDYPFQLKSAEILEADLQFARLNYRGQKRLFLADGDVLILSQKRLVTILTKIRQQLPWVKRISLYANARAIRSKSQQQLHELKTLGLDRVYLGLESGCDQVLQKVQKGESAITMIAAARQINMAGIFLSVTILLGLGEKILSSQHAVRTAEVLNQMQPRQIAALTLMPLPNTKLGRDVTDGAFTLLSPIEILHELKLLVSGLSAIKCQFHVNHASNYLPIEGRLPRDKALFLAKIEQAISGATPLVPEFRRAL